MHTHAFPKGWFEAVWSYFETRGWAVHRQYVGDIQKTLTSHGIDKAVALSYPHAKGVVQKLNHFMIQLVKDHPFFIGFGSVHIDEDDFDSIMDEVFQNLSGFKFQPLVQCFDINHSKLDPLYDRCVAHDFPILIHAGTAPTANDYVGFKHFQTLMKNYPDLRVCVAHLGAFECEKFLHLCKDHPNMYLDTAMIQVKCELLDTFYHGDEDLLKSCADRICYGSDWPNVPYDYQECLASIERFPFSQKERQAMRGVNGARFLKLSI